MTNQVSAIDDRCNVSTFQPSFNFSGEFEFEDVVIFLVLYAQDPEGCRNRLVEEQVRRRELEGKKLPTSKLVFILNKIGRF